MSFLNKNHEIVANGAAPPPGEKAQNVSKSLETMAHDFGSDLGSAAHSVSQKTSEYVKTSRDYISENPIQSLAVAATAGIVLGSLLTILSRRN